MDTDPRETVRRGYDALSHRYDEAFGTDAEYGPWIADLLGRIGRWLRPGGTLLATTGHGAWTGTDPDRPGGGVPMWWSQADAARYREWITGAGPAVEAEEFVPEGEGGHALFLARRP